MRLEEKIKTSTQNHFSLILLNKISNALFLTDNLIQKLNAFTHKSRSKRGLIDGVGIASKWLFGTLDIEDETITKK